MNEPEKPADLQARIEHESGIISWQELARHFARGVVIKVDTALDLVAVGVSFAEDDKAQVQRWLDSGQVARASDDDARGWSRAGSRFTCIVFRSVGAGAGMPAIRHSALVFH